MRKAFALVAFAGVMASASATAQNLVTNGDFEAGNTGFTSGYTYTAGGSSSLVPEGTYTVGTDSAAVHPLWASVTAQSGALYLIANGHPTGTTNVWEQTLNGLTVGASYLFSAYAVNVCCNDQFTGTNNTPFLVAVSNGDAMNPIALSGPIAGTGNWTQFTGGFVATSTSASLSIFNQVSDASGNDFGLDTISVTAVPEPAAWAMMILGVGAIGGALRRRNAVRTSVSFA